MRDDELTQVKNWRREQLERLELDEFLADKAAAELEIDWHEVAKLIESGCKPELALAIVA